MENVPGLGTGGLDWYVGRGFLLDVARILMPLVCLGWMPSWMMFPFLQALEFVNS